MKTRSEANLIIACLLSVVVSLDSKDQKRKRQKEFIPSKYDWTLSCFTRLWDIIRSIKRSSVDYLSEQCLSVILNTLCSISPSISFAKISALSVVRTATLLSQIAASALLVKPMRLVGELEKTLCFCLFELTLLFKKSHTILEVFDETLFPILIETVENNRRINAFGVDLQVCQNSPVLRYTVKFSLAIYTIVHQSSISKRRYVSSDQITDSRIKISGR